MHYVAPTRGRILDDVDGMPHELQAAQRALHAALQAAARDLSKADVARIVLRTSGRDAEVVRSALRLLADTPPRDGDRATLHRVSDALLVALDDLVAD